MSNRYTLAAALLAASTTAPSYAGPAWNSNLSDVFSNVSGSVSIDNGGAHQSQVFGPSAANSGDGDLLGATVWRTEPNKSGVGTTNYAIGAVWAESRADGTLTIASGGEYTFLTPYVETATWTATLTNPFPETRSFQLLQSWLDSLTVDHDFQLTVNGAPIVGAIGDAPPYPTYSVGTLASGASETISMTLRLDSPGYCCGSANKSLIAYASSPVSPVPEPATMALFTAGLAALGAASRRRARRSTPEAS